MTFSQEISSTSTSLPTIPSSTSVVLKATSINSTYLALLDAGIALNSIVTAIGISILNSIPILDPTPLEESQSTSSHLFVYSFKGTEQGECIGIESSGKFSVEEFEQCRELGESGSEAVRNVLRKAVEGKYGVNEMKQERMEE